jgi:TRAP-type C4-dicarboxylate transport system permease small subunit
MPVAGALGRSRLAAERMAMMFRIAVHRLVAAAESLAAVLLIGIVALNLAAVFQRYVMLDAISWSEEAMRYASIWVTFLAACGASLHDEHMSLTLLSDSSPPWLRRLLGTVNHLLAAGFAAMVLWQGVNYCLRSGMQTAASSGLPMIWAYGSLAVGGALLLVVEIAKAVETAAGPKVRRA